jgi:Ca-activated chloride channel family protein
MQIFNDFQFLRPLWLLMIALQLVLAYAWSRFAPVSGWSRYIAADKIRYLQVAQSDGHNHTTPLLHVAAILGWLALAGPSFTQLDSSAGTERQPLIVLMDLSPSMLATDISPSRIELARLKLIDFLRARAGLDIGLVVYAGGAHRVAPLTDDPGTIEALVPVLEPSIMPRQGSNPLAAVEIALQMFEGAGVERGELLLVSDGIDADSAQAIATRLDSRWRLSVLAIGVDERVSVPMAQGGYLRDENGATVLVELTHQRLQQLAQTTGGQYAELTVDDTDLIKLSKRQEAWFSSAGATRAGDFDRRHDVGYWLIVLMLPIVLLIFRTNQFWVVAIVLALPLHGRAADWQGLWFSDDQHAARALQEGDAATASTLFRHPEWRAVAHYKNGNFAAAAELFARSSTADGFYNLGNALAMSGELAAAIRAYQQSLVLAPDNEDALHNLQLVQGLQEAAADDENQRRQSAGNDEGEQPAQQAESDPPPAQQRASDSRQQRVGGATGQGQSLAQHALEAGGQSGNRPAQPGDEIAEEPAGDAQAVQAPPIDAGALEQGRAASDLVAAHEKNDNAVLNPYSEQWLRELPQDPGGYLRRKFHYEAQLRAQDGPAGVVNY